MELDLRLVRYAIAVADELHFGRAAARLLISEQTLSAQIKVFEERLGVVLFYRDRRHVEVMPLGRVLVDRGRELLAAADGLLGEIAGAPGPLRFDVLMEGLTPTLIVDQLSVDLPGVEIEISQGQGLATSASRLLSGELDLACGRACGAIGRPLYGHMPVRLDPVGVMLPADHLLADRSEVRMAELSEFPVTLFSPAESTEWLAWLEELTAEFGLQEGIRLHGHGLSAVRLAVLAHRSPVLCTMDAPPSAGVVVRPLVRPTPMYLWSVVWRAARRDVHLKAATNAIARCVEERGWLISPKSSWWIPQSDRKQLRSNRDELPEPAR